MGSDGSIDVPSAHTPEGGVLLGSDQAVRRMVVFEDPQCPYCRQFEEVNGPLITTLIAGGELGLPDALAGRGVI